MRQAGDGEKRLVLVGVQTESIGQVTAMVVACIERKPERLCAGDEIQEVGNVVQKGLRARRYLKDMLAKNFANILGFFGGNTKYFPPRKNPTGSTT